MGTQHTLFVTRTSDVSNACYTMWASRTYQQHSSILQHFIMTSTRGSCRLLQLVVQPYGGGLGRHGYPPLS